MSLLNFDHSTNEEFIRVISITNTEFIWFDTVRSKNVIRESSEPLTSLKILFNNYNSLAVLEVMSSRAITIFGKLCNDIALKLAVIQCGKILLHTNGGRLQGAKVFEVLVELLHEAI